MDKNKGTVNLRLPQIPLVNPMYGFDEEEGIRTMIEVAGRREGKSQGISWHVSRLVSSWLKESEIYKVRGDVDSSYPEFAFFASTIRQAKNIIWKYLKQDLKGVPGIKFNNATLEVSGTRPLTGDDFKVHLMAYRMADRARGYKLRGAAVDEVQDCSDYALTQAIGPALKDSHGQLIQTGTADQAGPLYQRVKSYIEQGLPVNIFPANVTGTFSAKELETFEKEMGTDAFRREHLCDFKAALEGTFYYSKIMELERAEQFNTAFAIDGMPKVLAMDLGVGEGFCGWVLQAPTPKRLNLLDYVEDYESVYDLRKDLEEMGHNIDIIALPHDSKKREIGAFRTTTMKQSFKAVFPECYIKDIHKPTVKREAIENVHQHLHLIHLPPKNEQTQVWGGWNKVKRFKRMVDKETGQYKDQVDKRSGDDHAADALQVAFQFLKCRGGAIRNMPHYIVSREGLNLNHLPERGNPLLTGNKLSGNMGQRQYKGGMDAIIGDILNERRMHGA